MAYVTLPKDLTKVKSKVLFGLTKRQLICFGAAALIGVPLFFLRKTAVSWALPSEILCLQMGICESLLESSREPSADTLNNKRETRTSRIL